MELINNIDKTLKDDLKAAIKPGSKVCIAAACFSMYAFQELRQQLEGVEELRFIFTSPTFISDKTQRGQREFYIPRLNRERSLYGSEFEVKLRNELTQKAIARECAEWVRKKVRFRSNVTSENMSGFIGVSHGEETTAYAPVGGFTTVDIGCERGNNSYMMIHKSEAPISDQFLRIFEDVWSSEDKLQDVTEEIIDSISNVYRENAPDFIYFLLLYNIFNEFLEDVSEDELPNEATGFKQSAIWGKLYHFQKDAALAIINKLERYNGCILADSVGLGKTFTALAVIKYYENRNKSVLVLCPKKLSDNWSTYKENYVNNPIAADRLRYDVLYHTDLSREHGMSNGKDLSRLNWGNYDLVVIDESHNFRNGGEVAGAEQRENRYLRLMNRVIRTGVKTKVLMLSATPVNNRFNDLRNQLQLAYEGDPRLINEKLGTKRTIDEIFRNAQKAFNTWSRQPPGQRNTESLLSLLDFDFFEVLDSVTIARSRKHIEKYYSTQEVGRFPTRLPPIPHRPNLTGLPGAVSYRQIYQQLQQLNLSIYTPSSFIFDSKREKYLGDTDRDRYYLTQTGREQGIRHLMSVNLLKRLESSVHSFRLTLERILALIVETMQTIDSYRPGINQESVDIRQIQEQDFDGDDQNTDLFTVGRKVKIALGDMDHRSWRTELAADAQVLRQLLERVADITPEHDKKLQTLLQAIDGKLRRPINPGNKKVIVFTAFSDTAEYLYTHVSRFAREAHGLETAMISGSVDAKTTAKGIRTDLNTVLTCFSPISKEKELLLPGNTAEIDILIATDCISEGQNLQDCDYLVNYDIHWNPVRIIQRFGRIDRIGSRNREIQLVNFWPDLSLDEYINLQARVETRMRISVMTSTGDDDLLNQEEKGDLEYRKQQLMRLQEEVVDIEEMQSGVSIMDLGLNEFRLDLLEYLKRHPEIEKSPHGLHAVVKATEENPAGVIFVLRNINNEINIDNQNYLHPFYMAYLGMDGSIVCNHLSPKALLDRVRFLCKGKEAPDGELCKIFNRETRDGKEMRTYSALLQEAIASIIELKEQSEIHSLFQPGGTAALESSVKGLDDFELIGFLVVE